MPWLVSISGVVVSIGFMVIAAAMNWQYGLGIERTIADQYLTASIALGIDILKVVFTFTMGWAWRLRRPAAFVVSAALAAGLMCHSVVGIAGYIELNRAQSTGSLISKKDTSDDLQRAQKRRQARLHELGVYEPPTVVELRLQAQRLDPRWHSSRDCTRAATADSRTFCASYRTIEADKEKSIEAEKLEREIAELRQAINALASTAAIDRGDPRAGFVSRVFGWEILRAQTGLSLLLVAIIEGVATFGIYASLAHGRLRNTSSVDPVGPVPTLHETDGSCEVLSATPQICDVGRFALDCLQPEEGSVVQIDVLYPRYVSWCSERGVHAAAASEFRVRFERMCNTFGFPFDCENGRARCTNMAVKPVAA